MRPSRESFQVLLAVWCNFIFSRTAEKKNMRLQIFGSFVSICNFVPISFGFEHDLDRECDEIVLVEIIFSYFTRLEGT